MAAYLAQTNKSFLQTLFDISSQDVALGEEGLMIIRDMINVRIFSLLLPPIVPFVCVQFVIGFFCSFRFLWP